jgi:hypothetical protein
MSKVEVHGVCEYYQNGECFKVRRARADFKSMYPDSKATYFHQLTASEQDRFIYANKPNMADWHPRAFFVPEHKDTLYCGARKAARGKISNVLADVQRGCNRFEEGPVRTTKYKAPNSRD